jgi:hypothetical protein
VGGSWSCAVVAGLVEYIQAKLLSKKKVAEVTPLSLEKPYIAAPIGSLTPTYNDSLEDGVMSLR